MTNELTNSTINTQEAQEQKTKILFIAGWGRSGSTVIANILGSHPSIENLGELRYLWDRGAIENRTCGCGDKFNTCSFWEPHLAKAVSQTSALDYRDTIGSRGKWTQLKALLVKSIAKKYYRREASKLKVQNDFICQISKSSLAPVLVDASKTPLQAINYLNDPRIEIKVLHLVRDARAVTLSWKRAKERKEGVSGELMPQYSTFKSILFWNGLNFLCLRLRMLVGRGNYTYLNYEDFVKNPRDVINSILNEADLPTTGIAWDNAKSPIISASHSISGNPMRHSIGKIEIREDDAYKTELSTLQKTLIMALTAPTRWVFRLSILVRYIRKLDLVDEGRQNESLRGESKVA